jgi:hypothetical protein
MMVAITASRTLFESVLGQFKSQWETERVIPVKVSFKSGYVHPTIYALRRRERS